MNYYFFNYNFGKAMNKNIAIVFLLFCLSSHTSANAASNNGYTTGANVYTVSSSRGWYGGGVAYRLAEWRKEADVATEPENITPTNTEDTVATEDDPVEQSSITDPATNPQDEATNEEKTDTGMDAETPSTEVDNKTQQ